MDIQPMHSDPRLGKDQATGGPALTVRCAQGIQVNPHVRRFRPRRARVWVERRGTAVGTWCDACDAPLHDRDPMGLDPDSATYNAVQALLTEFSHHHNSPTRL